MGTNYYWHEKPPCEHCGRNDDGYHIGKSSAGWNFSLHVAQTVTVGDEDIYVMSLADWERIFAISGSYIRNEYRDPVSVEEMMATITDRKEWQLGKPLARHDFSNTVGLPPGVTYDLVRGDFT
jgi:hypothetical protein